jgi:hypothetical protein
MKPFARLRSNKQVLLVGEPVHIYIPNLIYLIVLHACSWLHVPELASSNIARLP